GVSPSVSDGRGGTELHQGITTGRGRCALSSRGDSPLIPGEHPAAPSDGAMKPHDVSVKPHADSLIPQHAPMSPTVASLIPRNVAISRDSARLPPRDVNLTPTLPRFAPPFARCDRSDAAVKRRGRVFAQVSHSFFPRAASFAEDNGALIPRDAKLKPRGAIFALHAGVGIPHGGDTIPDIVARTRGGGKAEPCVQTCAGG